MGRSAFRMPRFFKIRVNAEASRAIYRNMKKLYSQRNVLELYCTLSVRSPRRKKKINWKYAGEDNKTGTPV